jgi:hypothetical protein
MVPFNQDGPDTIKIVMRYMTARGWVEESTVDGEPCWRITPKGHSIDPDQHLFDMGLLWTAILDLTKGDVKVRILEGVGEKRATELWEQAEDKDAFRKRMVNIGRSFDADRFDKR